MDDSDLKAYARAERAERAAMRARIRRTQTLFWYGVVIFLVAAVTLFILWGKDHLPGTNDRRGQGQAPFAERG